ncbi:MAG: sodium-dependent bicarbonate transport family permease [Rhodospirillaceae bacterium]
MGSIETLLSPIILFFVLGMLAGFARSDLSIPEPIAKAMSLYLMAAIGLKGGGEVAAAGFSTDILLAAAAGIALSFALPLPAYAVLRRLGRLDGTNAAAVAAHYGSVSVVTFVTGYEMLRTFGIPPAGYMSAVLALMETPAIITGLLLARMSGSSLSASGGTLWRETLLNGSVVLLVGSFLIGLIAGKGGLEPVAPFFDDIFRGVLCLFLLDIGLIAARRLLEVQVLTWRIAVLAIVLPVFNGSIGVALGSALGLDVGSAAALGILAGSASYIAVPAVMRLALPQANPGLYLCMSLAITFPFNVVLGIPYYTALSRWMGGP